MTLNRWKILACTLTIGVGGLAVFAMPPANPKAEPAREPAPLPDLTVKPASPPNGTDTPAPESPAKSNEIDLEIAIPPLPAKADEPVKKPATEPVFEPITPGPAPIAPVKAEEKKSDADKLPEVVVPPVAKPTGSETPKPVIPAPDTPKPDPVKLPEPMFPVTPSPSETSIDPPKNQALADAVAEKLKTTGLSKGAKVDIKVVGGVVTLTGSVPTNELHAEILKAAQSIRGIQRVESEIVVGAAEPDPIRPASSTVAGSAVPLVPSTTKSEPVSPASSATDRVKMPLTPSGSGKGSEAAKLKMLLRMGDGQPRFEIRNSSTTELLLKVYGERVEMQSPRDARSSLAGVTATGHVRFTAPSIEGTCDHLTILSGTGEVLMEGNIRLKTKRGKAWSEMTAEKLVYQIGASGLNAGGAPRSEVRPASYTQD